MDNSFEPVEMLPTIPKIKFKGLNLQVNGCTEEQFVYFLGNVIVAVSEGIGFNSEKVEAIVFASEEEYGNAIKEYEGKSNFTKDDFFVGAGKTIRRVGAGNDKYVVVLKVYLLQLLVDAAVKSAGEIKTPKTINDKMALYILAHELGHCLDFENRTIQEMKAIDKNEFKIKNINLCNGYALLMELAACVHSGGFVDTEYLNFDMAEGVKSIQSMYDKINDLRSKYKGEREEVGEIANLLIYAVWRQIGYYANWQGFKISNPDLLGVPFVFRRDASEREKELVIQFCEETNKIWKSYPDWNYDTCLFMERIFHEMVLCSGFVFKMSDGNNDGLYWQ